MKLRFFICFILLMSFNTVFSQVNMGTNFQIAWDNSALSKGIPYFKDADFIQELGPWPVYVQRIPLSGPAKVDAWIDQAYFEDMVLPDKAKVDLLSNDISMDVFVEHSNKGYFAVLRFVPIVQSNGQYKQLVRGRINLDIKPISNIELRGGDYTYESVLNSDEVYKIGLDKTGIYKLDRSFLKDLGIDVGNLNPKNFHVYGHPGGRLPQSTSISRVDDLEELSIEIIGENDGRMDKDDYVLFYAMGSNNVTFNESNGLYSIQKNIYSDSSFYYVVINDQSGKRISQAPTFPNAEYQSTSFNAYAHYENDLYNLLGRSRAHLGSGQLWVGEEYTNTRERNLSNYFLNASLDTTKKAHIKARFLGRSGVTSTVEMNTDGQSFKKNISSVNISEVEATYARYANISSYFNPKNLSLSVKYNPTSRLSEGWLDYITLNFYLDYNINNVNQKIMSDIATLQYPTSYFKLLNASSNDEVWDVTDIFHPERVQADFANGQLKIGFNSSTLRKFIAFNPKTHTFTPEAIGRIENQNLHAIDDVDEIIVYHPRFEDAANKLAEHRESYSNLKVTLVRIDQIMNEFASGKMDPTALRDFVKMVHDRTDRFKYLLLMGDGSYDYMHKVKDSDYENFIPAYETKESLNPIYAYPSDDYYALLSDGEGKNLAGGLDLSVGRILSRTSDEALLIVNRIINYETSPESLRDWKNRILFSADDEDGNLHIGDIERVTKLVTTSFPTYNLQKIYLDAYDQISTPGGERYPDVTKAIDQSMFKGTFSYTYLGHGGPTGLTQERVLQIKDVLNWSNKEKVPIFMTATCSFTPYDDPEFVSIGEETVIHTNGGIVALLSTVRAVYASSNARLTRSVLSRLYQLKTNRRPKIGEVVLEAKNASNSGSYENNRKFSLFGDPAMDVMLPLYNVRTDEINGQPISVFTDTLHAMDKITIKGSILGFSNEIISDFNGVLYPTIFDKKITLSTKQNDPGSPKFAFDIQKNILYKGSATINNGQFEFTFNIPKDINYSVGLGKFSYYATDGVDRDASGYYSSTNIGGANQNNIDDDEGPLVEVYMNSFNFMSGGITGPDPVLLVKLTDDRGINVSGNSIGHDLLGILDNDNSNKFILNDHYEAERDDYTKGTIRFPLKDLALGRHEVKVIAWDVANNVSEGFTEFIVEDDAQLALKRVLNYPNPFMDFTNFRFEHNLTDASLYITIQIYTISGILVKTINASESGTGSVIDGITWDGRGDHGQNLSKGIYIYKINVSANVIGNENQKTAESSFEKLVILK